MRAGFYWIRDRGTREVRVVEVIGERAFPGHNGKVVSLGSLRAYADFLSKEPLTPPEVP